MRSFIFCQNLLVGRAALIFKNQNRGNQRGENSDGDVRQFDETSGWQIRIIFRHLEYRAVSGLPGPNDSFC